MACLSRGHAAAFLAPGQGWITAILGPFALDALVVDARGEPNRAVGVVETGHALVHLLAVGSFWGAMGIDEALAALAARRAAKGLVGVGALGVIGAASVAVVIGSTQRAGRALAIDQALLAFADLSIADGPVGMAVRV